MQLPYQVPAGFRIIAHRGASAYAPENTATAFKLAADMQVREFELDTQLSTDGTVVLCHDTTLERYGHGNSVVEAMTWDTLAQLDMGSWFSPFFFAGEKMLTLETLLRLYGNTVTYHVEIKGKAKQLPQAVCTLIHNTHLQEHCIVTSFSYDALLAVRAIDTTLRLGWLVPTLNTDTLAQAHDQGFFQVCPRADTVTAPLVAQARDFVPEVRAWGVTGSRQEVLALIQQVVAAGCDGMTMNWPDWVIHRQPANPGPA